ncbi:Lysophospholipase L1 [Spirosomataceae bacterium TFI 002]|nr:Lysophospholipase L1 [Spirosomataceae bacterium TFI 002]
MLKASVLILFLSLFFVPKDKSTLFIIGDSTVKAGQGKGGNNMWGWGSLIDQYLDSSKIKVENHAIGGRSSRTFLTEGRWEPLLSQMKKGDFLLIQFGHNDDWALNDTIRARGTIDGIGEESVEINNLITLKHETVYTYGWYLRKYANEAKAKGVEVFICTPIPFNRFDENNLIPREKEFYTNWAKQVAEQSKVNLIDLHEKIARVYDSMGYEKVKELYFTPKDNVHTNYNGAMLNAQMVISGIKESKIKKLRKAIL